MERLLTLREAAELLQINERTALRLAHAGKLPASRVGGQWRIHPVELERWFLESSSARAAVEPAEQGAELFSLDRVLLEVGASVPDEVFDAIAETLARTGHLIYPDVYKAALRDREILRSTGIGGGVALPHARNAINDLFRVPLCVFLRLASPVDFQAADSEPVDLVFAVAAPTNATHLRTLAAVMAIARDSERRRMLREADGAPAVLEILRGGA